MQIFENFARTYFREFRECRPNRENKFSRKSILAKISTFKVEKLRWGGALFYSKRGGGAPFLIMEVGGVIYINNQGGVYFICKRGRRGKNTREARSAPPAPPTSSSSVLFS